MCNSAESGSDVLASVFKSPPDGLRGFDTDSVVNDATARAFADAGYRFCVRYVRRQERHPHDLSGQELTGLLGAGLGVMAVQHVAPDGWSPTAALGASYGSVAATEATAIGIPSGVTLWCDLEGVALGTPARHVIGYCNEWYAAVQGEGFVPGLYVGFRCGVTAAQLYHALRFSHFWGAYNVNADEEPAVRGFQMKQSVPLPQDCVMNTDLLFQIDTLHADALGGRPTLLVPDAWFELARNGAPGRI
jgi:hypothetical protein